MQPISQLSEWARQFPLIHLKPRQPMLTSPHYCLYLQSGLAKMSHLNDRGDQVLLNLLLPHCIAPLPALFNIPFDQYEYHAVLPCTGHRIPLDQARHFITTHPQVVIDLFNRFLIAFADLAEQVAALKHNRADEKITVVLNQLHRRAQDNQNATLINALTQEDIANLAGVSRETVSRIMAKITSEE